MNTEGHVAGRYSQLLSNRDGPLRRARSCSKVTLPSLIPEEGHGPHSVYPTPYQSLGARGVNNLASKLLLALLPPNSPFFKLDIADAEVAKIANDESAKANIQEGLAHIEREVVKEMEGAAIRVKVFEALKHLLVSGNVLLYVDPNTGKARVFPLSRFVVKRSPMGDVNEIIVAEDVYPIDVPQEQWARHNIENSRDVDKTLTLYTRVYRKPGDTFEVHQELNGVEVVGSRGTYAQGHNPWMALRWTAVENEDYGRGFCEEHLGDLNSYNRLNKAMLDGAAAASRVLFFLRPGAAANKRKIASAPNGEIIEGNIEDISAMQLEKYADFQISKQQADEIAQRLAMAFMLNSAIQRQGERVTAEEIRFMAGELEDALGGVYSVLSQEFQLPLVQMYMLIMTKQGKLPVLPKGVIKPSITTGLEALGRGQDLAKLGTFLQGLQILGPEIINQYVNVDNYITRVGTAVGLDTTGLVKSQEQIQQEAALMHQRQLELQTATPQEVPPNG